MTSHTRSPRAGYVEHDHVTEWQECDTCGVRLGEGLTTRFDGVYFSDNHDPDRCPRPECDGRMCLPEDIVAKWQAERQR